MMIYAHLPKYVLSLLCSEPFVHTRFDFFLVAMWLADMVIAFPVNSSQLRLIRLVRLLRLVRLVRVVRGFDSLIVMTTALQESAT